MATGSSWYEPSPVADPLGGRRLYLCTGDRSDLASFVAACIRGGVDLVQLRDKQLEALPLLRRAEVAIAVCRDLGVPFILNDRPDLALACGADGVHVGQDDVPPWVARQILGPDAIVGRSTHAPAQLLAAAREPVDYLSAGPVNPTPTKLGRPGTGLGYLREAARRATVPWFVTGGVTPSTVKAMIEVGARRFVVVRYLTEASDPEGAARSLRSAIAEAEAGRTEAGAEAGGAEAAAE
ncbi:MAG: thiamine-phosphate pyrophosphorylase [Acidimicrobiaceae bacterium]|jgi:thiamine-phosphate pyrophosphorylase|nr:thiamine-phosphate pyrophosphorylase [Acidimicrobiaceae bacterium]